MHKFKRDMFAQNFPLFKFLSNLTGIIKLRKNTSIIKSISSLVKS